MAGEPIKYGLKSTQIDGVLHSSKAIDKLIDSKNQISNKKYKILKNYFNAWQKSFKDIWFNKNNTLTKIAGFRFISYLFPYVYEVLENKDGGIDFTETAFSSIVKEIKDEHFNDDFDTVKAGNFQSFQERSGISKLATQIGKELIEQYKNKKENIHL